MAQINDPDDLSQGGITVPADVQFKNQSGAAVDIDANGGNDLPALTVGDFFEIRGHSVAANNGLYLFDTENDPNEDWSCTKQVLTGSVVNPVDDATDTGVTVLGTDADEKNVFFDTLNLKFTFLNGFGSGVLLNDDGVLGQAFYSFCKIVWKADAILVKFIFPMTAITPEQFEFNNWAPVDEDESSISTGDPSNTRQLLRTCGWDEVDAAGFIEQQYFGWVTLGTIDASDFAYAFYDSAAVAADIITAVFDGAADEAVRSVERFDLSGAGVIAFVDGGGGNDQLTRATGSWITDGVLVGDSIFNQNAEDVGNDGSFVVLAVTATDIDVITNSFTANADDSTVLVALDHRSQVFTPRIRVFGKTYDQSSTTDIGVSVLTNQVYRFPLGETTDPVIGDLGVSEGDAGGGAAPYNDMNIEYFATTQTRDNFVLGDNKEFGTIIDGDISEAQEDGGGAASAEEIFAFVQASLNKTTDIDNGGLTVIGRLAEPLLSIASTGNDLFSLAQIANPANPALSGVYVDTFSSADKNRVNFIDDADVVQTFPLTVSIAVNFNANLVSDVDAVYTIFFTNDDTGDDTGRDFGTVAAIIVEDDVAAPQTGAVPGAQDVFNYAYSANAQRGSGSGGTDAPITIVALGLNVAQYVLATGTITNAANQSFSLVAALERNFSNP